MNKRLALLTGMGVGAGVMFLLDPDRGARRRALVRDKVIRFTRVSGCTIEKLSRDLRNRVIGVVSELRSMAGDGDVSDSVLVNRIKAQLGRYPVHDRSISIDAQDGVVTLTGDSLERELQTLISAVSSVRGVKDVINNLTVHETAEGISSLQGRPVGVSP
jgi:BON domain